jgi:hypothetical protein
MISHPRSVGLKRGGGGVQGRIPGSASCPGLSRHPEIVPEVEGIQFNLAKIKIFLILQVRKISRTFTRELKI